jgi:hypothetical protein
MNAAVIIAAVATVPVQSADVQAFMQALRPGAAAEREAKA